MEGRRLEGNVSEGRRRCRLRTMSTKLKRVILTLAFAGVFSLASMAFLPVFFVIKDVRAMRAPHTINGHAVIRHGRSRLSQVTYEDGHQLSGKVFDGMCFVEYEHGGDTKRQSGRNLSVRTFYDSTVRRVVRTGMLFGKSGPVATRNCVGTNPPTPSLRLSA